MEADFDTEPLPMVGGMTSLTSLIVENLGKLDEDSTPFFGDGVADWIGGLKTFVDLARELLEGDGKPFDCSREEGDPNRSLFDAYVYGRFVLDNLPEKYKKYKKFGNTGKAA